MMAAAAKEVPDSSSNHSRDDSSSGGDGSSSLSNHTVILGWNTKLASLVRQLAMANHSLGGGVIAVLADKDTQQMEEEMKAHELDLMGTSVIYHTGCPLDKTALQKACAVSVSVSKESFKTHLLCLGFWVAFNCFLLGFDRNLFGKRKSHRNTV
jgi:hypothetical protein